MKDGKSIFVLTVLSIFILYVIQEIVGEISASFFVTLDNILYTSKGISPIVMWMVMGLLFGIVYGSLVAVKKYKLGYWWMAYSVILLIVSLGFIALIRSFTVEKNNIQVVISGETKKQSEFDDASNNKLSMSEFNENLTQGIQSVENEEYKLVEFYFNKAAKSYPHHPKLDSLAQIYMQIGDEKCQLYRHNSGLRYLPNYYYKYAAALTSTKPQTCK